MEKSLEYLTKNHERLSKDYRMPDGIHSDACIIIACDIADELIKEGKNPHILRFVGKPIDAIYNRKSISPKLSSAKLSWGCHLVCCLDNLAYDPMVDSKPIPLEEYPKRAFYEEVDIEVAVPKEEIESFIKR